MAALRRFALAALGIAYLHLVFGAIVRITGSGMGCGDHWPKCHGRWFPEYDRPDLIIEITHRHLAVLLGLAVVALLVAAWRRRAEAGVGGPGGVLRTAALAVGAVITAGAFGAVTVKFGNPTWATVVHWTLAMVVLATLVAAAVRAGALGGDRVRGERAAAPGSRKTVRTALLAAVLAFLTVVLGGLTAKFPTANVACLSFPHCGTNPGALAGAPHVQMTHRVLAFLLLGHYLGAMLGLRKRAEAPALKSAAVVGLVTVLLQILLAAAMIGMRLPAPLRSAHEALGVLIWIGGFLFWYLARIAAAPAASPAAGPR